MVPGVLFATRSPRMTPALPILAVEDVYVIYGQVILALRGVSLQVARAQSLRWSAPVAPERPRR
jgi:hypothetical protein